MNEPPEINLARRVVNKHALEPPVDVLALARQYATVRTLSLPLNIDGISLGIKAPKRRPTIIVNDVRPETRKRFTLAHEVATS